MLTMKSAHLEKMFRSYWIVLVLQVFFSLGNSVTQNDNLLSTVVLFRHGDRAPISLYPNDPHAAHASTIWPEGFGQLSKIGKQQQYALGKWLRARYDGFLPSNYYYEDITVYSSDTDRCLMSAAANLAGLYPPEGDEVWNPSLLWQPIPIHTRPREDDPVLAMGKFCRKYEMTYAGVMTGAYFQKIFADNRELFEYLSANSGNNVSDLGSFNHMWNTLHIEQIYNLTLPEWTQEVYPDKMEPLTGVVWRSYTYTAEMALLKSGRLIDIITTHFEKTAAKTATTPKLLMFSAHDSTIADLLNSLNLFDDHWPEYASTVILELRQGEEEQQYVNILYKQSSLSDEVKELTLEGCQFDCDLSQFQEIVQPIRADQIAWDLACRLDS